MPEKEQESDEALLSANISALCTTLQDDQPGWHQPHVSASPAQLPHQHHFSRMLDEVRGPMSSESRAAVHTALAEAEVEIARHGDRHGAPAVVACQYTSATSFELLLPNHALVIFELRAQCSEIARVHVDRSLCSKMPADCVAAVLRGELLFSAARSSSVCFAERARC